MEERNWWFLSRRNAIVGLLKSCPKTIKILDVGCAGGALLLDLEKEGFTSVYGLDFSKEAIETCKSRGLKNVFVMDGHKPEFPDESFDIIISSDSLEHLENDTLALSSWFKILKSGGKIIVFVPAFMSLWSEHDEVNHHFRRYQLNELVEKVSSAGFRVEKNGFWNFAIFFPTYIFRKIQQKVGINKSQPKDQLSNTNPIVNAFLSFWLRIENAVFLKFRFPIGVSAFIMSSKK